MFTKEEIKFIEIIIEDELLKNATKRSRIDEYKRAKEFDEIMKPREDFMREILRKIRK